MISEPEMSDASDGTPRPDDPQTARAAAPGEAAPEGVLTPSGDVVSTGAGRRTRQALLVLGTALLTSALWAGGLKAADHGHGSGPDLHGYRVSGSPCAGDTLAPLGRALGRGSMSVSPAETSAGPAVDQAQCHVFWTPQLDGTWRTGYSATVTVTLHKKTDPGPEFADLNKPKAMAPLPAGMLVSSRADIRDTVLPVRGLGDEAYLLVGDPQEVVVTARHGGAVVTVDLRAGQQWAAGPDGPPPDGDGFPQRPPSLDRFRPAVVSATRDVMAALAER